MSCTTCGHVSKITCLECEQEKGESSFYTSRTICKKCYNARRKTTPGYIAKRKKKGFLALPDEKQEEIRLMIADGKKCSEIASASGVKYSTMSRWLRNHLIA